MKRRLLLQGMNGFDYFQGMKWYAVIPCICLVVCCAKRPVKSPPTVLEEKKVDVSFISKGRNSDMVEALYEELVNRSAELTELEQQIAQLKKDAPDSLSEYKQFNEKNTSYYDAAIRKVNAIGDSMIRKKMRLLIMQSQRFYVDSTARFRELSELIAKRTHSIDDLHILLKLVKTLPIIEDYQHSKHPPEQPAEQMLANLDSLVLRIDSLAK